MVSLAPSCTEIVCALGCQEQLVGRTAFCDFPPEVAEIPTVGGWTTADVDAVVALNPDLVFTSTFLQGPIVTTLRERGVRVCHTDPRTLEDVISSFETIASALGVSDRGRVLRERVEASFSSRSTPSLPCEAVVQWGPLHPRVYAEEWPSPPMASGNWVPDLLHRVGAESFLPPGERSREVTLAEVRTFDPDIIVLNYCGMERVASDLQVRHMLDRAAWGTLRAVQAGRIVVVPDSLLNRPGPRLVEGAWVLATHLARVPALR